MFGWSAGHQTSKAVSSHRTPKKALHLMEQTLIDTCEAMHAGHQPDAQAKVEPQSLRLRVRLVELDSPPSSDAASPGN